jgi:transcriptional regulator with XRE-family HTH domain
MDPSFGTRLRLQRERQQVGLDDIAERTKIKRSLLEGLERDDLAYWPGGIYRRSYVRAYAQAIGLTPDTVVREFLELYPDPVEEIAKVAELRSNGDDTRSPMRLRSLVGKVIGALPALRTPAPEAQGPPPEPIQATPPSPFQSVAPSPIGREVTTPEHSPATPTNPTVAWTPGANSRRIVDLLNVAPLCTRLARATDSGEVTPVLEDAVRLVDAVGLIVWLWDLQRSVLEPVLSLGYSSDVVAHLGSLPRDTDNAVAVAFSSGEMRVVHGDHQGTGAVVVPLHMPSGCAGVLALELRNGGERRDSVRAFATILAAQLSTLIEGPALAGTVAP